MEKKTKLILTADEKKLRKLHDKMCETCDGCFRGRCAFTEGYKRAERELKIKELKEETGDGSVRCCDNGDMDKSHYCLNTQVPHIPNKSITLDMESTPKALRDEEWFGVWDKLEEKIIYIYKDQLSAINQARRGTNNWVIIKVRCSFDPETFSKVNCCCK